MCNVLLFSYVSIFNEFLVCSSCRNYSSKGLTMKTLNFNEIMKVSGGIASMQFGPEGVVFITTGASVNSQGGMVNGVSYSMVMYSDHITDMSGNSIFVGNSGNFCHKGSTFKVSPVVDGLAVVYKGSC